MKTVNGLIIWLALTTIAIAQTAPVQQELKDAVDLCKDNTVRPRSDSQGYKPGFEMCSELVARYAAEINAVSSSRDAEAKAKLNSLVSKIK